MGGSVLNAQHGSVLSARQQVTHSSAATVHDLHIWALGSKQPVLTAHIVLKYEKQLPDIVRQSVAEALKDSFDIERATLQVDASTLLEGKVHE